MSAFARRLELHIIPGQKSTIALITFLMITTMTMMMMMMMMMMIVMMTMVMRMVSVIFSMTLTTVYFTQRQLS